MQELTIEEKAKICDESYERAAVRFGTNVADEIFIGLKESEDDSAVKEITKLIMNPTWKTEKEFNRRKSLVAWLEREHVNAGKITTHFSVEQEKVLNNHIDKMKKQNSWNEEDERILNGIIGDIQRLINDSVIEQLVDCYNKEINWLQSIKNRIQKYSQQEWRPAMELYQYIK